MRRREFITIAIKNETPSSLVFGAPALLRAQLCGACYYHCSQQPRAWIHGWLWSPLRSLSPSQNAITQAFKVIWNYRPVRLSQNAA